MKSGVLVLLFVVVTAKLAQVPIVPFEFPMYVERSEVAEKKHTTKLVIHNNYTYKQENKQKMGTKMFRENPTNPNFAVGNRGENKCPTGYGVIKDRGMCQAAAQATGYMYYDKTSDLKKGDSVCNYCGGCVRDGGKTVRIDSTHGAAAYFICKLELNKDQFGNVLDANGNVLAPRVPSVGGTTPRNLVPLQTNTKCANENQRCSCTGTVYYGKRYIIGQPGSGTEATFAQLVTGSYKQGPSAGSVMCNNAQFGDPIPGFYKICFCSVLEYPQGYNNADWGVSSDNQLCNWQCYLDRYPDLQRALGKHNLVAAKKHYFKYGIKEKRDCTCPVAINWNTGCPRPAGWCVHPGSVFEEKDCDGDGIPDPTCRDARGNFGVRQSTHNCADTWPHGTCVGSNWYRRASGVGTWGGTCTCPDGQKYMVGDNNNYCRSIACEGGTAGQCMKRQLPWRNRHYKVTCAVPDRPPSPWQLLKHNWRCEGGVSSGPQRSYTDCAQQCNNYDYFAFWWGGLGGGSCICFPTCDAGQQTEFNKGYRNMVYWKKHGCFTTLDKLDTNFPQSNTICKVIASANLCDGSKVGNCKWKGPRDTIQYGNPIAYNGAP